jgi:hypothetical protein
MRGPEHAFRGRLPEGIGTMERSRCFGLLDGRHFRVVQAALIVVTQVIAGLPIGAAAQTTCADAQGEASGTA